jgi:hypothetical protein
MYYYYYNSSTVIAQTNAEILPGRQSPEKAMEVGLTERLLQMLPEGEQGGEGRYFQVHTPEKLQQGKKFLEDPQGVSFAKEQALLPGLLQCEKKRGREKIKIENEEKQK